MEARQQKFWEPAARYGNLMLLAGLICVLAMMFIPLPAPILDVLLAFNLMGALTLLMVALSLTHSLQLATFPTLLLIATLFRLGLNISSTRLILTEGYAGHIIETFGRFVTGGHLTVGLIMFFILTVIQFVVIAKGSERVAEVAARFSLDALPGKQMSIDADLRSGQITQEEAKSSRERLQKESRMYGAMDGAMKFVKGDAVAGILITLINILGGLFSGVVVKGLLLKQALNQYSILAIGDGLINQIPALLISITAGIIITRVNDEESQNSLGNDIGTQIFSHPKALLMAAGLALFLSLVPGFPMILFLAVAAALAGIGIFLLINLQRRVQEPATVAEFVVDGERRMTEHVGQAIPLVLEVGPRLFEEFHRDMRWRHCFDELYSRLRARLTQQMGVHFPELRLSLNQGIEEPFRYHIRIWDVPVDYGYVDPQHCCRIGQNTSQSVDRENSPVKEAQTVHGTPILLYHLHQKKNLEQRGIHTLAPEEMLLRHLARVLKKHAGDFIGIQEVHHLLNIVELKFPDLVREVIPKMMSIQKLTEIVKRLVEEDVPIKDFRLILQTLSGIQPEEKDPVTLTEQVRIGLRRTLSYLYSEEGRRLNVVTIEPDIEASIRRGIQKNGQECFLVLPPSQLQELAYTFKYCLFQIVPRPPRTVILTQLELRRYVRKIIENDLPHQAVLSYQELDPKLVLNPVGKVQYPLEAETVVVMQ